MSARPRSAQPPASTAAGLRRRLEALRTAGPVDHALDAGLLALDITNVYRRALLERDAIAARLHRERGWTYTALARVTDGDQVIAGDRGSAADRVRRAVESVHDVEAEPAEPIAELGQRQADVVELRGLMGEARRLAATHLLGRVGTGGGAGLGLPENAGDRVRAIAGQQRLIDIYLPAMAASRNAAAAALVVYGGWSVSDVAGLARTSAERIDEARGAVAAEVVSYPDPGTVTELADVVDALARRRHALGRVQDDTMRALLAGGVPGKRVAALAQVSVEHVERLRPVGRARRRVA